MNSKVVENKDPTNGRPIWSCVKCGSSYTTSDQALDCLTIGCREEPDVEKLKKLSRLGSKLEKEYHTNLRSSVNDIGEYTTQIFIYKNGIKKTVKNLVSSSICESEMLKIMDKNGVMHIINKANLLHTEVHPQDGIV